MDYEENNAIKAKNIFLILFSQVIGVVVAIILAILSFDTLMGGFGMFLGIILIIASCAYPLVMMTKISSEINMMCEDDGDYLMPYVCAALLGCITFGIYYIYYLYRMQNRLNENAYRYDAVINERGGTIVLWLLLGNLLAGVGTFVALAIIIRNFNKMAYKYNEEIVTETLLEPIPKPRQMPNPNPAPIPGAMLESSKTTGIVRCLSGTLKSAEILLDKHDNRIVIGRNPSISNLVISGKKISKKHCIIRFDADQKCFFAQDCNSTNGTKLSNGVSLMPNFETKIMPGVTLILPDDVRFEFEVRELN